MGEPTKREDVAAAIGQIKRDTVAGPLEFDPPTHVALQSNDHIPVSFWQIQNSKRVLIEPDRYKKRQLHLAPLGCPSKRGRGRCLARSKLSMKSASPLNAAKSLALPTQWTGKSTLFNTINRIQFSATYGDLVFNGEPIHRLANNGIAKRRVVLTFQQKLTLAEQALDQGQVIAMGAPSDVVNEPAVIKAYRGATA